MFSERFLILKPSSVFLVRGLNLLYYENVYSDLRLRGATLRAPRRACPISFARYRAVRLSSKKRAEELPYFFRSDGIIAQSLRSRGFLFFFLFYSFSRDCYLYFRRRRGTGSSDG